MVDAELQPSIEGTMQGGPAVATTGEHPAG